MTIYLFVYAIIGWLIAYVAITEEPSFFKHNTYAKAAVVILLWPIILPLYLAIMAML